MYKPGRKADYLLLTRQLQMAWRLGFPTSTCQRAAGPTLCEKISNRMRLCSPQAPFKHTVIFHSLPLPHSFLYHTTQNLLGAKERSSNMLACQSLHPVKKLSDYFRSRLIKSLSFTAAVMMNASSSSQSFHKVLKRFIKIQNILGECIFFHKS